jgi:hypothetical protein
VIAPCGHLSGQSPQKLARILVISVLDDVFDLHKIYTATFQKKTQTVTNGVLGAVSWVDELVIPCIFWRGSVSTQRMSDKFKAIVDATMVCKPADITSTTMPKASRIMVENGSELIGYFSALYCDDVAGQGEVVTIPMKEYT